MTEFLVKVGIGFALGFILESQDNAYVCPQYCAIDHLHHKNKIHCINMHSNVSLGMAKADDIEYSEAAHKQAIEDILHEKGEYMPELKDLALFSAERKAEYDRRKWKYDDTVLPVGEDVVGKTVNQVKEAFTYDKGKGKHKADTLIQTAGHLFASQSDYNKDFDFEGLLAKGREGGYVHHKHDRGGATKYGVTEAEARDFGYKGEMQELPKDTALDYYHNKWNKEDKLWKGSKLIQNKMFDISINMGRTGSLYVMQEALNALGYNIGIDGTWEKGRDTDTAYNKALVEVGDKRLFKAIQEAQKNRYQGILEGDDTQEAFKGGWLNRVGYLEDEV